MTISTSADLDCFVPFSPEEMNSINDTLFKFEDLEQILLDELEFIYEKPLPYELDNWNEFFYTPTHYINELKRYVRNC
jgi:hypothetical protein